MLPHWETASGTTSDQANAYFTPDGWQTACVDRFLFDVPKPLELSAASPKYKGGHSLEGMEFGSDGVHYAGYELFETTPTDLSRFSEIYRASKKSLMSAADYKNGIKHVQDDFVFMSDVAKRNGGDANAAIRNFKEISDDNISKLRYGLKVSGEKFLKKEKTFFVRREDEFTVGYYDSTDNRARIIEGVISKNAEPSPQAAYALLEEFRGNYQKRSTLEVPNIPGFCTNFGFIRENKKPEDKSRTEILFHSRTYPGLVFKLLIEPSRQRGHQNIQDLPKMDSDNARLHLVGVRKIHGPVPTTISGSPGRIMAHEYGDNCSKYSCRPADQAYDLEAETFGEPGRLDRPHIILNMTAATPDDYRLKLPAQPNEPSYNQSIRPALSGKVPPPFAEGKAIFEQVLRSIRFRTGAI